MSKILVTGGAGFIGSHITDALIDEGHEVHVLDNLSAGNMAQVNRKAVFHEIDLRDRRSVENLFTSIKFKVVFHEAAQMSVIRSVADPANDAENNILGTIRLLIACKEGGVKKVIYASSGGVIYGDPEYIPQDESHPLKPASPYGISKLSCEKYLDYFWTNYGLSYISLRYGNVYGPRQSPNSGAGIIGIFMEKILAGQQPIIYGQGTQTRDYIFISDVINANLRALEYHGVEAFNVGTGVETDVNTIFDTIKEISGANVQKVYGPAKSGEQARSVLNIHKAKKLLKWSPVISFEEGMRSTIKWYIDKKSHE